MQDNITKYPRTDKGRRDFIHDAFLSAKDVRDDEAFVVHQIPVKPDRTLQILNGIAGFLILVITAPINIPSISFMAIKRLVLPALERTMLMRAKYLRKKRKDVPRDKTASIVVILFILSLLFYILAYMS